MRAGALHSRGRGLGTSLKCCDSRYFCSFKCFVFVFTFVSFFLTVTLAASSAQTLENEEFLENPKYLHNDEISSLFASLQRQYPHLARAYSIGKTIENRDMNVLALTASMAGDDASAGDLLKPVIKVTANIHGDETLGRQMILYLAQYLTSNYAKVKAVQQLMNTTEIHLLPSCNPDGFAKAKVSYLNIHIYYINIAV